MRVEEVPTRHQVVIKKIDNKVEKFLEEWRELFHERVMDQGVDYGWSLWFKLCAFSTEEIEYEAVREAIPVFINLLEIDGWKDVKVDITHFHPNEAEGSEFSWWRKLGIIRFVKLTEWQRTHRKLTVSVRRPHPDELKRRVILNES